MPQQHFVNFSFFIKASAVLFTVLFAVVLRPPKEFPDRLAKIPEDATDIDNLYYNIPAWAETFRSQDGTGLGNLFYLNSGRVPYFERIWKREIGTIGDRHFLDIGCGGGVVTNQLAKGGFRVDGIDMAENALAVAQSEAKKMLSENQRIPHYKTGSAYNVPVAASWYDGVVMSDVLEHFHDVRQAIQEVHRVLKPGGIFVFDTINRTFISWVAMKLVNEYLTGFLAVGSHDWRLFITPNEMKQVLEEEGFEMGPSKELSGLLPINPLRVSWGFREAGPDMVAISYLWWARKK